MLKSFRNDRSVAKFDAIFKLPNLRTIAIHLQQWDSKPLRSFTHKIRLRIFSMYPRNKSAVCTKNASRRRIHREFSANSQTIRLRLFPCIRTIRWQPANTDVNVSPNPFKCLRANKVQVVEPSTLESLLTIPRSGGAQINYGAVV